MNKGRYTREEVRLLKEYAKRYKNGGKAKDLAKELSQKLGRTYAGIFRAIYKFAEGRRRAPKNKRTGRRISESGRMALSRNGQRQNVIRREKLRSLGLTDAQIEWAMSPKRARLDKTQVEEIEAALEKEKSVTFEFTRNEDSTIRCVQLDGRAVPESLGGTENKSANGAGQYKAAPDLTL